MVPRFVLSFICAFLLAIHASVLAQNVGIAEPKAGQVFKRGKQFKTEIELFPGSSSAKQVSIAIGIRHCLGSGPTCNPDIVLGSLLFSGPFKPGGSSDVLTETFHFTLPWDFQKGLAELTVAHFYLVGAEFIPVIDIKNTTVTVK